MTQSTRLSGTQEQESNATTKVVPHKASSNLYYANQQNKLADLRNFDFALDEKNPQPEYLSRIFDHAELQKNFLDEVLKLCKQYKNDAIDFSELKIDQFTNQSLFDDDKRLQNWVTDSVVSKSDDSDRELAGIIKRIFTMAKSVIIKYENLSREFVGLYSIKKDDVEISYISRAARQYSGPGDSSEYVACLFVNGVISLLCRKLSEQIGSQHGSPHLIVRLMKHQLNTHQNFIELFTRAKDQFHHHDMLSNDESIFHQFINNAESSVLGQSWFVDSGKYIPLLTLAVRVMLLPKSSFAYDFGMRELIQLIGQFEEMNRFPKVEKNACFNQELVQPLLLVISQVTEPDPSKNQVRAKNAAVILNHHIDYLDFKLRVKNGINVDLWRDLSFQVYSLSVGGDNLSGRTAIEAIEERLRKIRNVIDIVISNDDLQKEIINYLLGPRNKHLHGLDHQQYKSADVIIEDIIEYHKNTYYQPKRFINLFRLINKINESSQYRTYEERKKFLLVLNQLIYQYKFKYATQDPSRLTKEIGKNHFTWSCDRLYEYHKELTSSVVDDSERKEQKSSVDLSYEMFKCYRDMLAIVAVWKNVELFQAVEKVGQAAAIVPIKELFEPMKLVCAILYALNALDRHINLNNSGNRNKEGENQAIAVAEGNIKKLLLNQEANDDVDKKAIALVRDNYRQFKIVGQYLEYALLARQLKLDNEEDLSNRLITINPSDVSVTNYYFTYKQLQSLDRALGKRTDLLAIAARNVLQDAKAEFRRHLMARNPTTTTGTKLQTLLAHVNHLVGPDFQHQDLKSLTDILDASIPEISTQRAVYSSLCIFAGIATLALGFALSPMTSFTLAYLSMEAASVLMAVGVAAILGTAWTLWQAKQPIGVAASLGGFIKTVNKNVKFVKVDSDAVVDRQASLSLKSP